MSLEEELHTLEQRVISLEKLVQELYRIVRIFEEESKAKKRARAHPHWSDLPF